MSALDYFSNLPDEAILHILSFLPHRDLGGGVALVNKRFLRLSMDHCLWEEVRFPRGMDPDAAKRVLDRCDKISELILCTSHPEATDDIAVYAVETRSTTLRRLTLNCFERRFPFSHRVFRLWGLGDQLGSLTHLDISGCISMEGLEAIGNHCKSLKVFSLCDGFMVSIWDGFLRAIGETVTDLSLTVDWSFNFRKLDDFFPLLEHLRLKHVRLDSVVAPAPPPWLLPLLPPLPPKPESILPRLKTLSLLRFTMSSGSFVGVKLSAIAELTLSNYHLSDANLEEVVNSCPGLLGLDLSHCRDLTDTGIRSVMFGCPRLRRLILRHIPGLSSRAIRDVTRLFIEGLEVLDVTGCGGGGFDDDFWLETISFSRRNIICTGVNGDEILF